MSPVGNLRAMEVQFLWVVGRFAASLTLSFLQIMAKILGCTHYSLRLCKICKHIWEMFISSYMQQSITYRLILLSTAQSKPVFKDFCRILTLYILCCMLPLLSTSSYDQIHPTPLMITTSMNLELYVYILGWLADSATVIHTTLGKCVIVVPCRFSGKDTSGPFPAWKTTTEAVLPCQCPLHFSFATFLCFPYSNKLSRLMDMSVQNDVLHFTAQLIFINHLYW